jgi:RNA polymerase sigma-70 factor (ECF subfamily)
MASDPALCLPWDPPAAAGPAPADAEAAEAALVERARREPQAFAELYRMHYSAVGRYLFRRTGDAHATEDLLSEVFLAALRGIGGFRSRGIPFRYWLLRIATNAANREAARRGPELRPLESAAGAAAAPDPILGNPHLDDRQRAVLSALRTLGAKHQSVLSLHYLQELKIEEIALVLGCRPGTVKSRLARARAVLAARIRTHKS